MARIRTIKPQHVTDKELPKISLQAHLLWVLNWCFSDDEGVFENDPLLIKSNIFPRRTDIRVEQISQWLGQLEKARYIIPFTHDGESYYINRTFKTHQRIDRPQPSKIPSEIILRVIDEHSTNVRPCIVEDSKGKDSSGDDGEKSPPKTKRTPEEIELFKQVQDWIKEKAGSVARMKEPLTIDEYMKLKELYPDKAFIGKILMSMHNWGKLKDRKSAYLTFLRFAERETAKT